MNTKRKPACMYALTMVTVGDQPSRSIAMAALRKIAQMSNYCSRVTKLIENYSYVDDLLTSVDEYAEASVLMQEIDTLLQKGCF